jgi:hypothetical protein
MQRTVLAKCRIKQRAKRLGGKREGEVARRRRQN